MKKLFFLPHSLKWVGYPLLMIAIFCIVWLEIYAEQCAFISFVGIHITLEFTFALLLTALLILFFSREKQEDIEVYKIKKETLILSVCINSILLLISMFLFFDSWIYLKILNYNTVSIFLIHMIIFYFKKRSLQK